MRRRQRWTAGRVISKASPLKGRGEDRKESNLPPRMDRHQPAEHRLDVRVHEPCLGDHAFEGRHVGEAADRFDQIAIRSEEHTSELQTLMRNSYAVFCLKKKTITHDYILSR